jgi:large subunit ribosomal protein L35
MPKQKTHKGMKKRFKITASGKARHRKAFRGHLMSHKSGKQVRQRRNDGIVIGAFAKHIRECLAPGD